MNLQAHEKIINAAKNSKSLLKCYGRNSTATRAVKVVDGCSEVSFIEHLREMTVQSFNEKFSHLLRFKGFYVPITVELKILYYFPVGPDD